MKVHSLSTRHYADGGVGEVFESTKHFRSLMGKQRCSQISTIDEKDDQFVEKQQKKTYNNSILPVWCHPSVRKARHSYPTRYEVFYTVF